MFVIEFVCLCLTTSNFLIEHVRNIEKIFVERKKSFHMQVKINKRVVLIYRKIKFLQIGK